MTKTDFDKWKKELSSSPTGLYARLKFWTFTDARHLLIAAVAVNIIIFIIGFILVSMLIYGVQ